MQGEVFKDTLLRAWRPALYWAIGMAIYGAYVVFLIPDSEGLKGYVSLLEAMPKAMLQAVGVTDISIIATPEGFLGFAFFTYGAVILAIYAVLTGLNITANDEELGMMNMLLSLPLPRWRVVVERALANVLLAVFVVVVSWLGLVLMTNVNPTMAVVDPFKLLQACLGFLPTILLVMAVTVLLGVSIRRRNIAGALAGGFVAVSYVLNTLGAAAGPGLGDTLKRLSFFSYYDGTAAALNGLDFGPFILLIMIASVLAAASVRLFTRRDISA